ncbi:uncharacterized protein BX663DRAFT_439884, partial [Cokeromyces recurvatus]|uniref:uncharacterized protein n=1 Tax=Cokeromyces recurvatus TaxID=90255 RepID=UPI002220B186
ENIYNEQERIFFDPMEDVLAQITNLNIVLEIIISQSSYLDTHKSIEEKKTGRKAIIKSQKGRYPN